MHRQYSLSGAFDKGKGAASKVPMSGERRGKRRDNGRLNAASRFRLYLSKSTVHGLQVRRMLLQTRILTRLEIDILPSSSVEQYLLEPHWSRRLFWLVSLAAALAAATYFVSLVFAKWSQEPGALRQLYFTFVPCVTNKTKLHSAVLTDSTVCNNIVRSIVYVAFDTVSTPVWQLPFPALTVCNINQVTSVQSNDGSGLYYLLFGPGQLDRNQGDTT